MNFRECPCCGHINKNLEDSFHRSGTFYKDSEHGRIYGSRKELIDFNGEVWQYNCENCDLTMYGDSQEEVIKKWNKRVYESRTQ